MIEIQNNVTNFPKLDTDFFKKAIRLTLNHLDEPEVDITLRLTRDYEMRQLNQTFRGIAKTTDVLAFNQDTMDPETNRLYLGDVVISVDRASQQAQEEGHSLDHEIAFLAIHGALHLLGFDHAQPKDKQEMWGMQSAIHEELIHQQGNNHHENITQS